LKPFMARLPVERWQLQLAMYAPGVQTDLAAATNRLPAETKSQFRRTSALLRLVGGDVDALANPEYLACIVARDLVEGKWHSLPRPSKEATPVDAIAIPASIDSQSEADVNSPALADAAAASLDRRRFGSTRAIRSRLRVLSAAPLGPTHVDVPFSWHEDGRHVRALAARPSTLSQVALGTPQLKPTARAEATTATVYAPEIAALAELRLLRSLVKDGLPANELTAQAAAIAVELGALSTHPAERATAVQGYFGTEAEQWKALTELARESKRLAVASSFVNLDFCNHYAEQLQAANPSLQLTVILGHADERPISEHQAEAAQLEARLRKAVPSTRVILTTRRTHLKVVLSDSGRSWIGSCNLFSCAPGSDVFESGVIVDGPPTARLRQVLRDHVPNEAHDLIPDSESHKPTLTATTRAALEDWQKRLLGWKGEEDLGLDSLQVLLQSIAEAPVVQVVHTGETRQAVLDLVECAQHRLLLATDRIKPAGLDPQLTNRLTDRPYSGRRAGRFTYHFAWGREDPAHVRDNEAIDVGRKLFRDLRAGILKKAFDEKKKQQKNADARYAKRRFDVWFMPQHSDGPFMNHAKALAIDDASLLLTSDNLLVYGSDRGADDSTELGVIIHNPRISKMLRGELEFSVSAASDPWDYTKWQVALATAVQDLRNERGAPLGLCMASLLERARHVYDGQRQLAEAAAFSQGDAGLAEFVLRAAQKGLVSTTITMQSSGRELDEALLDRPSASAAWETPNIP
jgi:phosphatidylserine/phosphatidylglycerophosphate/cardiolipin synthase-like enzyme